MHSRGAKFAVIHCATYVPPARVHSTPYTLYEQHMFVCAKAHQTHARQMQAAQLCTNRHKATNKHSRLCCYCMSPNQPLTTNHFIILSTMTCTLTANKHKLRHFMLNSAQARSARLHQQPQGATQQQPSHRRNQPTSTHRQLGTAWLVR
jgi:hypothetical protein